MITYYLHLLSGAYLYEKSPITASPNAMLVMNIRPSAEFDLFCGERYVRLTIFCSRRTDKFGILPPKDKQLTFL
jgi:hypothetical protein